MKSKEELINELTDKTTLINVPQPINWFEIAEKLAYEDSDTIKNFIQLVDRFAESEDISELLIEAMKEIKHDLEEDRKTNQ